MGWSLYQPFSLVAPSYVGLVMSTRRCKKKQMVCMNSTVGLLPMRFVVVVVVVDAVAVVLTTIHNLLYQQQYLLLVHTIMYHTVCCRLCTVQYYDNFERCLMLIHHSSSSSSFTLHTSLVFSPKRPRSTTNKTATQQYDTRYHIISYRIKHYQTAYHNTLLN